MPHITWNHRRVCGSTYIDCCLTTISQGFSELVKRLTCVSLSLSLSSNTCPTSIPGWVWSFFFEFLHRSTTRCNGYFISVRIQHTTPGCGLDDDDNIGEKFATLLFSMETERGHHTLPHHLGWWWLVGPQRRRINAKAANYRREPSPDKREKKRKNGGKVWLVSWSYIGCGGIGFKRR